MTPKRRDEILRTLADGADSLDLVEISIEIEEDIIAEQGVTDTIGDVLRKAKSDHPDAYKALMTDMDKRAASWIESWERSESRSMTS